MLDRPSPRTETVSGAVAAPLLALAGTLCDARPFESVFDRLGVAASVPPLSGATTATDMAERILSRAPERISLCGFSLGAIVALEMIARAPGRIELPALIGCNPGLLSPDARAARERASRDQFVSPGELRLVHQMAAAASDAAWREQTAITLSRSDSRPRLSRILVPTLVLCGADDRICPPAMSREIAASIVGAQFALIPDAGHYVTIEQPARVANHIAAWLAAPARHKGASP